MQSYFEFERVGQTNQGAKSVLVLVHFLTASMLGQLHIRLEEGLMYDPEQTGLLLMNQLGLRSGVFNRFNFVPTLPLWIL